jgi:hypothetical protein
LNVINDININDEINMGVSYMPYNERKEIIKKIERLRQRKLISLCNFDRMGDNALMGLNTHFDANFKECLYTVLNNTVNNGGKIDVFLYTRGGDTNSVWPIVSLIHEFDPDFEVLIPFRAHSAGTLLVLAAKKIVLTKLSELSPIDPTTGNLFNPIDPTNNKKRLGISVEDLNAYSDFIKTSLGLNSDKSEIINTTNTKIMQEFIDKLINTVHPLAIGNVHRIHKLIVKLAKKLLELHPTNGRDNDSIIAKLTSESYSHLHIINRNEAKDILGKEQVIFADSELEVEINDLLIQYEEDFSLRNPLFLARLMEQEVANKDFRFVGGVVESIECSYSFNTEGKITQFSKLPPNVTIQLPPGQLMPLIPGLPREYYIELREQKWELNTKPRGITK